MKQIEVFSETGEKIENTYSRRAVQLVKNGKAQWKSKDSIVYLLESHIEEADKMKDNVYANNPQPNVKPIIQPPLNHPVVEANPIYRTTGLEALTATEIDEELYTMAKNRLQARMSLIIHWIAFVFIGLFGMNQFFYASFFNFLLFMWFAGVLIHTAIYFFGPSPERIIKQYNRYVKSLNKNRY